MYRSNSSLGALIEEELRRQERSVSWFARHLACDRRNVYRIFRKNNLDTELVMRISRILNHDFFADLSRMSYDRAVEPVTEQPSELR